MQPFSARLLTDAPCPPAQGTRKPGGGKERLSTLSRERLGYRQMCLQFSIANPAITTTIAGSANPENIRKWAQWAAEPSMQHSLKRSFTFSNRSRTSAT